MFVSEMAEGRKCIKHVHSFVSAWGPVCIYGVFGSWTSSRVSVLYLLLNNNMFMRIMYILHALILGVPYFQQCCVFDQNTTITVILKNIITIITIIILLHYYYYYNIIILLQFHRTWFLLLFFILCYIAFL